MRLVNYTPHEIVVVAQDERLVRIPSSGIARCSVTTEPVRTVSIDEPDTTEPADVVLVEQTFGAVIGLPDPVDGVIVVVSGMVLDHPSTANRGDLAAPGDLVRNAAGQPIGCRGLRLRTPPVEVDLSDCYDAGGRIDEGWTVANEASMALDRAGVRWTVARWERWCAERDWRRVTSPFSAEVRTWMASYRPSPLQLAHDPHTPAGTVETERAHLADLAAKAGVEYHGETLAELRARPRGQCPRCGFGGAVGETCGYHRGESLVQL